VIVSSNGRMRYHTLFPATLAGLLLAVGAVKAYERPPPLVYGAGVQTCAEVSTPEEHTSAGAWELGYWSGLNEGSHSYIGVSLSEQRILAAIGRECEAMPHVSIAWATVRALQAHSAHRRATVTTIGEIEPSAAATRGGRLPGR
jgi:hypothetical protein